MRLAVADPNCSMIKNCAELSAPMCLAQVVEDLPPSIEDDIAPQPYDGQFAGLVVLDVELVP